MAGSYTRSKLRALAKGDPRRIMLCSAEWFSDMMPFRMKVRCGTAVAKQSCDTSQSHWLSPQAVSKEFLSKICFVTGRSVDRDSVPGRSIVTFLPHTEGFGERLCSVCA
jgi:hypothetical protein